MKRKEDRPITDEERIKRDRLELLINPPVVIGPNTVILCPPLGSTKEYMKYLKDNREHYRAFFGLESSDET